MRNATPTELPFATGALGSEPVVAGHQSAGWPAPVGDRSRAKPSGAARGPARTELKPYHRLSDPKVSNCEGNRVSAPERNERLISVFVTHFDSVTPHILNA